jgi:hypothetical protein
MVWTIGIDPSSKKLAFCLTQSFSGHEEPGLHKISLPAGVYSASGCAYREAFLFFQDFKKLSAAAYMEAPVVGRGIGSTIVQAQVGGAVIAAAENAGVPLYLVNVASWKKKVLGKGNLKKEEVSAKLRDIWPEAYAVAHNDQDLIDACCLNRYGVANRRLATAILNRSQRARTTEGEKAARRSSGRRSPGRENSH